MSSVEINVLMATAASIGFLHTILGPDHYLPFIVMSRAGKWSLLKTAIITFLSGIGHILSSVVLGFVGIAVGAEVCKLQIIEAHRGALAGWALIAFGLVYGAWGLRKAIKNREAVHTHILDGKRHLHVHKAGLTVHDHEDTGASVDLTPWIIFTIFVFGPCEPLIPLLMYPAAQHSTLGVVSVAIVFGAVTISTMLTVVILSALGVRQLQLGWAERYTHALAGGTICLCGIAIQFLGL
jgi:nickel/cobalt exporter